MLLQNFSAPFPLLRVAVHFEGENEGIDVFLLPVLLDEANDFLEGIIPGESHSMGDFGFPVVPFPNIDFERSKPELEGSVVPLDS